MSILEKLKEIMRDEMDNGLEVAVETATENTTFAELQMDSLDALKVIMAVEEEFGIEVSGEAADEMQTVGDLIEYIESNGEEDVLSSYTEEYVGTEN